VMKALVMKALAAKIPGVMRPRVTGLPVKVHQMTRDQVIADRVIVGPATADLTKARLAVLLAVVHRLTQARRQVGQVQAGLVRQEQLLRPRVLRPHQLGFLLLHQRL